MLTKTSHYHKHLKANFKTHAENSHIIKNKFMNSCWRNNGIKH